MSIEATDSGQPVVSIVTIVYNNARFIRDAIESVLSQDYPALEYVVVDGGSTDGTWEIVEEYKDRISVAVSEPDDGLYDALNKGIGLSSGEYVGLLHSDDLYCDGRVISDMVAQIQQSGAEFGMADLVIVDQQTDSVVRQYRSGYFRRWLFRLGWQPPHPTCLVKRQLHDEFGLYQTSFKICGDFDFLVRVFYGRDIHWTHLNRITHKMRQGGISNSGAANKKRIFEEIRRSLKANAVFAPTFLQFARYLIRVTEFAFKAKRGCGS